jgi:hypothetical protein
MKFYRDVKYNKIRINKLTAIFNDYYDVCFYKNGLLHNTKNAAFFDLNGNKAFYLNDDFYGYEYHFAKKSWRRFVKMNTFL